MSSKRQSTPPQPPSTTKRQNMDQITTELDTNALLREQRLISAMSKASMTSKQALVLLQKKTPLEDHREGK